VSRRFGVVCQPPVLADSTTGSESSPVTAVDVGLATTTVVLAEGEGVATDGAGVQATTSAAQRTIALTS
jgi:hypothetical protein